MLTDGLYRVDPKALQGQLLRWRDFQVQETTAGTNLTGTLDPALAQDQCFVIKTVGLLAQPAATQQVVAWAIDLVDTSGRTIAYVTPGLTFPAAPATRMAVSTLNCEHLIFGGTTIEYAVNFDAGALSNFIRLTVSGWQLPRGNINY